MSNIRGATNTLHRSEGGVRECSLETGPLSFAREVARYIACPSTVRVRTLERFGRAPSVEQISSLRRAHMDARAEFHQITDHFGESDDDRYDYRVQPSQRLRRAETRPSRALPMPEPTVFGPRVPPAMVPDIIAAIARAFNLTAQDVLGPTRLRYVVRARQTCAYVLWKRGNSYPQVGRWLGGRDHSTMIHSCRTFEKSATPAMRQVAALFIKAAP